MMIIRTIIAVFIVSLGFLVLAGFLALCEAKQEQVRPDAPLPKTEKPIPAESCKPPMIIQFWVSDSEGHLKLAGYTILPGSCSHE
jgi:hypothetical protein